MSRTPTTWGRLEHVAEHLGLCTRTVRELMTASRAAGLRPCWVDFSGGARPAYRFDLRDVDRWFREVAEWRTSERAAESTRSAGETALAAGAPASSPAATTPAPSSPRRSERRRPGSTSSLAALVLAPDST